METLYLAIIIFQLGIMTGFLGLIGGKLSAIVDLLQTIDEQNDQLNKK